MKKSLFIIPLALLTASAQAQNEYDALRFSRSFQQGTARSTAMGGAFGALGGDLSCLAANPAGMSVYKRSEFTFTPQFYNTRTESVINGYEADTRKFSFKMANVGFVQSIYDPEATGFKGWAWGVAFNRIMDFNGKRIVSGRNTKSSMLDVWADNSDGLTPPFNDKDDGYLNSYNSALAYHAYLLDNDNDRHYYSPHSNGWHDPNYVGGYGEMQEFVSKTKGGLNTWDLAISGNYADKLLFGASISLSTLRYKQTSTYSEDDDLGHFPYQHWDFDETIKITGGGVNLKAGVIYKPVNYLRFGAAIHTPTWYRIIDKYYTELKVSYDKQAVDDKLVAKEQEEWLSPDEPYKYNLMTPFKAILSGAFIFPARGLLSVDYEYVNYSMTEYSNEDFDKHSFKEQNRAIEKKYEGAHNLRAGLEVKCTPNIALRAGYAVYGNPCKNVDKTFDRQIISGGIGFGDEDVFFDITGSYHLFETTEILYESANFYQDYNSKDKALYITMTLGLRF